MELTILPYCFMPLFGLMVVIVSHFDCVLRTRPLLNDRVFGDNARSSGAGHTQLSLLWRRLPTTVSPSYSSLVDSTHPLPQANNHCYYRPHVNDGEPRAPRYVLLLPLPTYSK
jgi:hypothetical protein